MRIQLTAKQWTKLPEGGTVYNSGAAQLLVMATDPAFTGTDVETDWDALQFNKGERFSLSESPNRSSDMNLDWYVRSHWDGHIDVNTRIHVGDENANRIVASHDCRIAE